MQGNSTGVFVPYRGIYFLYKPKPVYTAIDHVNVFVPYRGIYFLYNVARSSHGRKGFRPLSGNLLSLLLPEMRLEDDSVVFVPYRGIYFLYDKVEPYYNVKCAGVFVPYRGIYFLYYCPKCGSKMPV